MEEKIDSGSIKAGEFSSEVAAKNFIGTLLPAMEKKNQ